MPTPRATLAAALTTAGLLLTSCADPSSSAEEASPTNSTPAPKPKALASFEPCEVFKPQELKSFGVTEPGEPVKQEGYPSGCGWFADKYLLTVYKAPGNDLTYWKSQRSNYVVFEPKAVNDRDGIKAIVNSAKGQGMCRQIIEAGQGSVTVQVTYDSDKIQGSDPCAKALEIARMIEPRLPE